MLMRLGDIEIWRILESVDVLTDPLRFFPTMGPEGLELIARVAPRQLCPRTGKIVLPVQGFVVKDGPLTVLIDACVGNHKNSGSHAIWEGRNDTRFLAALTAAGVAPSDVTHVLCTHLHVDHVGWNTQLIDGRWVPTFPNARYLIPADDQQHFDHPDNPVYTESVAPVIAAGQAELVGPDHGIGDNIRLIPTPGHTPGHVSVEITGADQRLIVTGDALHCPAQCWHPEWVMIADHDPDLARASRASLLDHGAETGARVLGSHFPLPSAGRVRAAGGAFEWIADE